MREIQLVGSRNWIAQLTRSKEKIVYTKSCACCTLFAVHEKNPFQLYPNCQYWRVGGEEWKESIESLKGKQAHEHGAQCTHKRAHDVTKKERFAIDVNCELNLLSSGMSTKKNMSIKIFHAFSTSAITNLHFIGWMLASSQPLLSW